MKCYLIDGKSLDGIKLTERPAPPIVNEFDVLVDVKACSLNFRDLMMAKGQYGLGDYPATIPLSDMAGVVVKVGSKVSDLKPGDHILNSPFRNWQGGTLRDSSAGTFIGGMGLDGVLAEQILYPADSLIKIPDYLSFQEAATFTVAGLTAWSAIVTHGKTRPGEWVLLHGTGGVSIFAAQLAHAMGARTIMTTSSPEKAELVKSQYSVNETVNYRDSDWPKQVKALTQGEGVDVVVDVVGGDTLSNSIKVCNYNARVAVIGVLGGKESTIQTRDLLRHQVQIRGIYMESTSELRAFMKAVETLHLKPHVDKVFTFDQTPEAYRYIESQKHVGKIVITI